MSTDHYFKLYDPQRSLGMEHFVRSAAAKMRREPTLHEKVLDDALQNLFRCDPRFFRSQWGFGKFIFDFYCPAASLAIEVDGSSHRTLRGQATDLLKEDELTQRNIRLLRFSNEDVATRLPEVLEEITAALRSVSPNKKKLAKAQTPRTIRRQLGW